MADVKKDKVEEGTQASEEQPKAKEDPTKPQKCIMTSDGVYEYVGPID